MTDVTVSDRKDLAQFTEELHQRRMGGQWEYDVLLEQCLDGPPRPNGEPGLWSWDTVHPLLLESLDVVEDSGTARRALSLAGCGLFANGYQIIGPGEVAWAHRHSPNAIRFVLEGHPDAYTVVEGEKCPMNAFDLILTPSYSWHDHHNESPGNTIWFDVIDVPLVMALGAIHYEKLGEAVQDIERTGFDGGVDRVRAVSPASTRPPASRVYRWAEVEERLAALAAADVDNPHDSIALEYIDPRTGGPVLSTMGCWVQMLRPGQATRLHRQMSSSIFVVVRGHGTTVVGDMELKWGPKDAFFVPNWMWHHHENGSASDDAVLFSVNNRPLLDALGLYREEARAR